ncbi:(2Fe-2S)-binding protein [Actinophytocola sediminis]
MAWYLSVPGYVAALLFHHERRVPSLRPEHLAFRTTRPRPHPESTALLDPRFVCLPDDPAAGTPDATVVPDEGALAAVLRGRFTAHAARFVAAFAPTVRFGRHTLWAAATDALDDSMLLAGRYGGDEAAGVVDAALLLPERLSPLTSGSTMRPVAGAAGEPVSWTRRRESCCFHYLLEHGKGPCATCPRVLPR